MVSPIIVDFKGVISDMLALCHRRYTLGGK